MAVNLGDFERILRCASEAGISDVHIRADEPVYWKRGMVLSPLKQYVPTDEDMYRLVKRFMTTDDMVDMQEKMAANSILEMGCWRYRVHSYKQRGKIALAVRTMPRKIPRLSQLGQASLAEQFLNYHQGLLLITGATGAGKSTTVAALLDAISNQESLHILTLEDPVEYILPSGQCLVSQLEKGRDFISYSQAVENAMRQSPDIIMVSEMRDVDTVKSVLSAAVSGHYVIATMHAGSVAEAAERLVSIYPAEQQSMARSLLASALTGICTQQLVLAKGGSWECAVECLHSNDAVRHIIRSGKYEQLYNIMQSGVREGMQTMEMAVKELHDDGYGLGPEDYKRGRGQARKKLTDRQEAGKVAARNVG